MFPTRLILISKVIFIETYDFQGNRLLVSRIQINKEEHVNKVVFCFSWLQTAF